jgi:hypothetical protein
MAIRGLKNLCSPSYLYLVLSLIGLIIITFQNLGNTDKLCIGYLQCNIGNTSLVFVIQLLYILFWTWVLNLICDAGATMLSWLLVLFPIVLSFVIVGLMMLE